MKAILEYDKETKGTHRYKEVSNDLDGDAPLLGTLYIKKAQMPRAVRSIAVEVTIIS